MSAMTQIDNHETTLLRSGATTDQRELWAQLNSFELDRAQDGLTFTERLARENAWTLSFASEVIQEYKRFLFLAANCEHVVCPSDAVDQVWHMHLTYTRSYWDALCNEVLRRPLHHGPTRGGKREQEKYYKLYEDTRQSYEYFFGSPPSEKIWPPASQRFGSDLNFVRVNTIDNLVIRKPKFHRSTVGTASAGTAGAVLLFPLAQLVANPLNWTGPQFLILFFGLLVAGVILSVIARFLFASQPVDSDRAESELTPIDAAWLQGGNSRAVSCALLELAQADAVTVKGPLIDAGPNISNAKPTHRVSQLLLQCVRESTLGCSWRLACRSANTGLEQIRQKMESLELAVSKTQRMTTIAVPFVLLGPTILLGGAKLFVGFSRGRPVGFLVIAEVVAVIALAILASSSAKLTKKGKQILARKRVDAQRNAEQIDAKQLEGAGNQDLLWSTALLGTGVLAATPFSPFHTFTAQNASFGSSNSGGCGTSGCGGDSGCGGGGCGGGCGGCGG